MFKIEQREHPSFTYDLFKDSPDCCGLILALTSVTLRNLDGVYEMLSLGLEEGHLCLKVLL